MKQLMILRIIDIVLFILVQRITYLRIILVKYLQIQRVLNEVCILIIRVFY